MNVLVVDDSAAMRMMVKRTMRLAGFDDLDIAEAEDGQVALAKIRNVKPDVILSDWNMPNMDGLQLLQQLSAEGIDVVFGFITTEATQAMRETAIGAGARFLISKPFTPEVFETTLGPFLNH
jgi:two-component system chemotaxis response regulator CheY